MKNPKFKVTNNVFKHVFVNKIFTKQNKKPTLKILNYVRDMFLAILNKYNEQLNDYKDSITFVSQNYFNKKVKESHNDLHSLIKRIVDQLLPIFTTKLPEIEFNKDILIKRFNFELSDKGLLPEIEGDKVIQIGTTVQKYGEKECCVKHITTLGTCAPIDNCIVEACETETDVLLNGLNLFKN